MTDEKPNTKNLEMGSFVLSAPDITMSQGYISSGRIRSDLDFHIQCCRDTNNNSQTQNIFARAAIIYLAFYFECLSNSLYTGKKDKDIWGKHTKNITEYSKPIRKFIAYYELNTKSRIPLDYEGIQDLFFVRNKRFAHAPEMTTYASTDPTRVTSLPYKKFNSFPDSYVDFTSEHFEIFKSEVDGFLREYVNTLSNILPDWWSKEVGYYSTHPTCTQI